MSESNFKDTGNIVRDCMQEDAGEIHRLKAEIQWLRGIVKKAYITGKMGDRSHHISTAEWNWERSGIKKELGGKDETDD